MWRTNDFKDDYVSFRFHNLWILRTQRLHDAVAVGEVMSCHVKLTSWFKSIILQRKSLPRQMIQMFRFSWWKKRCAHKIHNVVKIKTSAIVLTFWEGKAPVIAPIKRMKKSLVYWQSYCVLVYQKLRPD